VHQRQTGDVVAVDPPEDADRTVVLGTLRVLAAEVLPQRRPATAPPPPTRWTSPVRRKVPSQAAMCSPAV